MAQKLLIKICGIKTRQTLDLVLSQGADMVGFMCFEKSPRHIDLEQMRDLISRTKNHASEHSHSKNQTQSVVVLVNPDMALIGKIISLEPDYIQLHGNEPPQFVSEIIKRFEQKVIKVLSVSVVEDLANARDYLNTGASLLLDAKAPKGATRPGGLGKVFDWNILQALGEDVDFMLSGGLNPHNVADAIAATQPNGIDVSSGVESAPGQKDHEKIKQFIANARAAQAS